MNPPREDVYCPACPDPKTAFRLKDVGMNVVHEDLADHSAMRIEVSRSVWEPVLIEHLRSADDEEHRVLYDLCVTELIAAGQTAEEAARSSVQAAMNGLRVQMARILDLDRKLDDWAIPDEPRTDRGAPMTDQPGFVPAHESLTWAELETATGGPHHYLSTACHHDRHDYCAAQVRDDGMPKVPSSCKFCAAPCECPCHQETP